MIEDPGHANVASIYLYNANGNLTVVGIGGQNRTFNYDAAGRLVSTTEPETGTTTYQQYDNLQNVGVVTDAREKSKTYSYDALYRVKSVTYSDGTPGVTFNYDNSAAGANANNTHGRLTSVGNSVSTTYFGAYDARGNVVSSGQSIGSGYYPFSYSYNLADALTSETYPDGRVLTTGYDLVGRPNSLSGVLNGATSNYITQQIYWPNGMSYYFTRGNNVTHASAINSRMQAPETYEARNNSTSSFLLITCPNWGVNPSNYGVYSECPTANNTNDNGNLQGYTEYQGGTGYSSLARFDAQFGYDGLNRLTSASDTTGGTANWSRSFQYDTWGNMWVSASAGVPLASVTPTSNTYNSSTNRDSRWSYDAAGNLMTVNGNTAAFDAENRMISLHETPSAGGGVEQIYYDALGRRVQKVTSGSVAATTVYVYDAFGLAQEYVNGSWSRDYIRDGGGTLYATENASGNGSPCGTCYFGTDHLGSVRLVMDASGNVVGRHDYLPFGEEVSGAGGRTTPGFGAADAVTEKFTGQVRDSESGLDYFNARYFGAAMGRFVSVDPGNAGADLMNPQSWNGYAYVLGSPLANVDPSGAHWETVCSSGSYALPDGSNPSRCSLKWIDDPDPVIAIIDVGPSTQPAGTSGGGGGGGNAQQSSPPKNGTATQIANVMRCASDKANSVSLAALLPNSAPSFLKNVASNDFSTISDLITGPGQRRDGALQSVQHGAGLNAAVYGVGSITTRTGFQLAQNGAGTYYAAAEITTQTVASTAAGKLAGAILGTITEGKLIYDGATYAGSAVACLVGW